MDNKYLQWDYKKILGKYDLTFNEKPTDIGDSPFFANGVIGSLLRFEGRDIVLEIDRQDVYDHRSTETDGWTAYSRPRLRIGKMHFKGLSEVENNGFKGRLSLYDAYFKGVAKTKLGSVIIEHYVHSEKMLIITKIEVTGKEKLPSVDFVPYEAKTTRPGLLYTEEDKKNYFERYGDVYKETIQFYKPNPQPELIMIDGINVSVQNFLAGGCYAVAWTKKKLSDTEMILYVSIENTYPAANAGELAAAHILEVIENNREQDEKLLNQHLNWWHNYYPISGIQIPDKKIERFYWIQIYKYGCITRSNGPLIDTQSIWTHDTPWPYVTNDLNTQMAYFSLYSSGRYELAESLLNTLKNNVDNLIKNVRPKEWQYDSAYLGLASANDLISARDEDMRYYSYAGNLMWLLHDVWLHYRYSMNEDILKEVLQPILKRALCFYFHLLYEDENKILHLPKTGSPEYGETRDCSFDLALLRWGCETYIKIGSILDFDDDIVTKSKDVLNRLTDYWIDSTGIRVGRDLPMKSMHRHFSHLLCIYPLCLKTGSDEQEKELIERSVDHWMSFPGQTCGYPIIAASSIHALLGNGCRAYDYLTYVLSIEKIRPNTMYLEAGPCIETPLMLVQGVHYMLLQSHDGIIKVFPAVPMDWKSWTEASFDSLCAEGGYVVSAEMKDKKVRFVKIRARVSGICKLNIDMQDFESNVDYKMEDGNIVFYLPKDGEAIFEGK